MNKTFVSLVIAVVFATLFTGAAAFAHCEIPCGIYDDELRVKLMYEHATTIEKSMKMAAELAQKEPANFNQIVRWITNKEEHADKIQHIVSQYFMTQRIKPDMEKYADKLAVLHQMLVAAMKCKQTGDVSHVETLRSLLKKFEGLYFEKTK